MTLLNAQRRDKNERPIIDALRAAGVYVQQMDKSAGFDLLCAYDGRLYILEVKDKSGKLSDAEQDIERRLFWFDIVYHIVRSVDEALAVFGLETL